jgi:hypothetical protein
MLLLAWFFSREILISKYSLNIRRPTNRWSAYTERWCDNCYSHICSRLLINALLTINLFRPLMKSRSLRSARFLKCLFESCVFIWCFAVVSILPSIRCRFFLRTSRHFDEREPFDENYACECIDWRRKMTIGGRPDLQQGRLIQNQTKLRKTRVMTLSTLCEDFIVVKYFRESNNMTNR